MNRNALKDLSRWKNSKSRKPLVIRGPRQVGKTWLMKTFGTKSYQAMAYVNLESTAAFKNLFKKDFDVKRILLAIQVETGVVVEPEHTLIILDEIQEAEGAITSLKYFSENAPEYHLIAAGSLLGVALSNDGSFPVGKVDFLDLYPLTFSEFLDAMGETNLLDLLIKKNWSLITSFRSKYIQLLKLYYYLGGMPEVVRAFVQSADLGKVREIQNNILIAYEQDFSRHAPSKIVPRIRMLWNSIPSQLAKENKKFIYGVVKKGARARDYEAAIDWLIDCGLVHKVHRVSKPGNPLKAYASNDAFKLYLADTGLLGALSQLDVETLLGGADIFQEFKGALTEQFVLQQLVAQKRIAVHYWAAKDGKAEVDFVLQYAGVIIPLEVKASENLMAKSLRVYVDKFHPRVAIRTSMSDFREESWLVNLPLYAIEQLTALPGA